MYIKTYNMFIPRFIFWGVLIPICTACVSGESEVDAVSETIHFSAQLQGIKNSTFFPEETTDSPEKGTYYLGYKENKIDVLNPIEIGEKGKVGDTGLYWAKVTKESDKGANFTLSNVSEDTDGNLVIPSDEDILWAGDTKWGGKLEFTLRHLMAQVVVDLSFVEGINSADVSSVSLTNMGTDILFDRTKGSVSTTPSDKEKKLLFDTTSNYYYAMLSPQERRDEMQLKVVMTNGDTYARKLPFAMTEELEEGNKQDVVLRFREGFVLHLTAKVTNSPDLSVLFTGATLVDWKKIGDSAVGVKPAGIYTTNELTDWATEYSRDRTKDNIHLQRYGVYDDTSSQWTFTLKVNITYPKVPTAPLITNFADKLENYNGATVKGVTQEEFMGLTSGGSVTPGMFVK